MKAIRRLVERIHLDSRNEKLGLFLREFSPTAAHRVLDVGVGAIERMEATNFLVRHYPHRQSLVALGLGAMAGFAAVHPDVPVVSYDGEHFPFADQAFDLVHSNAVIEHVGDENAQLRFLREAARVARAGMISTPNRYFPIELHTGLPFVHWFGKASFDGFIRSVGEERLRRFYTRLGRFWPSEELASLRLLDRAALMKLARRADLPAPRIRGNRLLGWTLTLSLVWGQLDEKC